VPSISGPTVGKTDDEFGTPKAFRANRVVLLPAVIAETFPRRTSFGQWYVVNGFQVSQTEESNNGCPSKTWHITSHFL
jgi:hypothetical protein